MRGNCPQKRRATPVFFLGLFTLTFFLFLSPAFLWAVGIEKQIGPLVGADSSGAQTSYADLGNGTVYIHWDSTQYTGATVYFEALLESSNGSYTASAALYTSGGVQVAGSPVSTTSTSYTIQRSGPITLTNGTDYKVMAQISNASGTWSVRAARLIVVQNWTNLSNIETYVPFVGYTTSAATSATTIPNQPSYYYDSSHIDGTVTAYFESTLWATSGQTAYARLYNMTDRAAVANSQISTTNTSKTRVRSAAITLTTGKEYVVQQWTSGGTGYLSSAVLIIQQSGSISITESHIPFVLTGQATAATSYTDRRRLPAVDPHQLAIRF